MGTETSSTRSGEFAEDIINTVREPLIVLDQDLRVVTVSRSFYEFFKVTPEETVGQLIYDLGNKQWDIPGLRELLENILPEKTAFDGYEVEHDFADIGHRIMLLNARQIERAWGKKRIILLAIEDVTERSHFEDLLEESESRYRRIYETATDGIVLLEKLEGHIVHANPAAVKMLGYSEEEYLGKRLEDIGVPIDMNDFSMIMASLNKRGILNYEDVQIKSKSGHDVNADVYMVNRAKLAQCNIRDVSARKQAENILKEEKKFIENALNTLKDIFFVIDLEGRFLRWNKTLKTVSGNTDQELSLKKVTDFFRDDEKKLVSEAILMAIAEGSADVEAIMASNDGKEIPFSFSIVMLCDAQNEPVGLSGVGRDLTEHKRIDSQLRQAQKMEAVGTLAGGIAHDFNNMLNVIMGYGNMILDTLPADTPTRKDMHTLLLAADKAASLTRRLLVFSRIDPVDLKPFDINMLLLELKKILVRIIRENIELHLDPAEIPLVIRADAGQLEQVLMNLVANARDAMQEGGQLTIAISLKEFDGKFVAANGYGKCGRYALIAVTDTGHGIDAATQKRIFEPFFTTKAVGEGTGLGLAISYGIIKQHNGYIKVCSEPGHGTVFNIYLPLHEGALCSDSRTTAVTPVLGGNETILIAEDDAPLRELTRRILESFGYRIIVAVDGDDAITKFEENTESIDLLFLDMVMPKKNGKEVAESIRKINPRIRVLFTSGYTMDMITSKELKEVGYNFIRKPHQSRELLTKVREVLDQ